MDASKIHARIVNLFKCIMVTLCERKHFFGIQYKFIMYANKFVVRFSVGQCSSAGAFRRAIQCKYGLETRNNDMT